MLDYAEKFEACARGDRAALRALFESEGPRLLGVAQRILHRRDLAEEAVQEGFAQIWRKAATYDRTLGSARGWIYAIVRYRALNMLRDGAREQAVPEEDLDRMRDANVAASWSGLDPEGMLRHCLGQLEPQAAAGAADGLCPRPHPRRGRRKDAGSARHREGVDPAGSRGAAGVHVVSARRRPGRELCPRAADPGGGSRGRARGSRGPSTPDDRALAVAVGAARDRLLPLDLTAPRAAARRPARGRASTPPSTLPRRRRCAPRRRSRARRSRRRRRPGTRMAHAALLSSAAAVLLAAVLTWQVLLAPKPAVLVVLVERRRRGGGGARGLCRQPGGGDAAARRRGRAEPGAAALDQAGPRRPAGLRRPAADRRAHGGAQSRPAAACGRQLYEITLEPLGGSPTGLPTGPVVGVGNAQVPGPQRRLTALRVRPSAAGATPLASKKIATAASACPSRG